MKDKSTGDVVTACAIIDELGSKFLQDTFHRSAGAVSLWKTNGIPTLIDMYLRQKYPDLRAFGGRGVDGISRGE